MNAVNDTRSALEGYLPLILGLLLAFLAGKALKKIFWSLFGYTWRCTTDGIHPFGPG